MTGSDISTFIHFSQLFLNNDEVTDYSESETEFGDDLVFLK